MDDRGDLGFYGTTSENEEAINRQIKGSRQAS